MTRRDVSESTVFKTCIEILVEINFLYKEENTSTGCSEKVVKRSSVL